MGLSLRELKLRSKVLVGQVLLEVEGADTITAGPEVTWTTTPTQWGNNYFENLFGYEWDTNQSSWCQAMGSKDSSDIIPDAHDSPVKKKPTMLTTDLALRFDPAYEKILVLDNPERFADARPCMV